MPIRLTGTSIGNLSLASASATTALNITATTSATATTFLTTGQFTLDNAGTYIIDLFLPSMTIGSVSIEAQLFDGSTLLTTISGSLTASVVVPFSPYFAQALAAGAHNLSVKAFVTTGGTGVMGAGTAGSGGVPNATLNVYPG